jgi:putative ABC transport system permease protein
MINKLVLQNIRHRWVRTLLSALVIGVSVTMMLTVVGLSQGMLEDSAKRAQGSGADIFLKPAGASVFSMSSAFIPQKFVPFVAKQPHVRMALGVVIAPLFGFTSMAGVDFQQFSIMNGGFTYLEGGPLRQPDDVIVDEFYARQNKVKVGQTLKLLNHNWHVTGIVAEGKLSHVIVSLNRLQDLTSNHDRVSQIVVKVDDPANTPMVVDELNKTLQGNLQALSINELASLYNNALSSLPQLKTFINVVIGLSIVIGFLIVLLSMYTAVIERTREIGVLKALGAKPITVLDILLRETFILAIMGCVIGILLSFAAQHLIMEFVPASIQIVAVPFWWPKAAVIATVGALLGATYPGLKAAKQDAIEALAYD